MADLTHDVDVEIQGQGQKVRHRELHHVTDTVIKDPNAPEAVQVPEGSGGSSVDAEIPLAEALRAGTPEEQFAAEADKPAPDASDIDQTRPAAKSETAPGDTRRDVPDTPPESSDDSADDKPE